MTAVEEHRILEFADMLLFDSDVLDGAARDLGRLQVACPSAVVRPTSRTDVVTAVARCAELGMRIAARGGGHSCYGQSLVTDGVVLDMSSLRAVGAVDVERRSVEVDAGARWLDVVRATAASGLRPPALTGYLQLTVGGTLSMGGISATPSEGAQVDRVRALSVVTGAGEPVTCSRYERPELFDHVLAGLGQVAVITSAVLDLVPAPASVRHVVFAYPSLDSALADARKLMRRKGIDELYLKATPPEGARPAITLLVVAVYDADDAHSELLSGLPEPVEVAEAPWLAHVEGATRLIDGFRVTGWDDRVKVWGDVWLPDHAVEQIVPPVLGALTAEEWLDAGTEEGFVIMFPHRRGAFRAPLCRVPDVPDDDYVWLFDVLTVSPDSVSAGYADRMLARNRALLEAARAVGGMTYPIGAVPMSPDDWRAHYGERWAGFRAAKAAFDPRGVLTPGPGIFSQPGSAVPTT